MDLRRNGLRDERRRRVLIDESLHAAEPDASSSADEVAHEPARNPVRPYSDAAIATAQTPVTVFLPKRPWLTWTVWVLGLLLIGGIELAYQYGFRAAPAELQRSLAALDVTARGSLASWFSAVVLGVSAFGALLVYQIRRHRTDDYRGRYRWWLWLIPLLLLLSIAACTGLHEALSGSLTWLTGAAVAVGGKGWWMLAYAALFLPISLQMAIELWPSRMATLFYVAAIAGYIAASLFELGAIRVSVAEWQVVTHSTVLLAAHLSVMLTVLSFGRYVYLDAHNQLVARRKWLKLRLKWPRSSGEPKPPRPKKVKESRGAKQTRVDEGHAKPGPNEAAPVAGATIRASTSTETDGSDVADGQRKLSKAERKRLRREGQ